MSSQADASRDPIGRPADAVTRARLPLRGNGVMSTYVDASTPNVARIYDYLLGGKDNYSADREAAMELVRLVPGALAACHGNRRFLQRAVRFLADEAGIRQFIDIGAGLPTQGNVHEVAQSAVPDARVLYVDYDPVVVSHAQALLADNRTVVAINRDLREPDQIIAHPALQALIDLDRPVAVLLVAILHFVADDDDPHGIVGRLKAAMPSGSYLVLSHVTADDVPAEVTREVRKLYDRTTSPATPRTRVDIARFFDGLEIVPPGLTDVSAWRGLSEAGRELLSDSRPTLFFGGVGRKP